MYVHDTNITAIANGNAIHLLTSNNNNINK